MIVITEKFTIFSNGLFPFNYQTDDYNSRFRSLYVLIFHSSLNRNKQEKFVKTGIYRVLQIMNQFPDYGLLRHRHIKGQYTLKWKQLKQCYMNRKPNFCIIKNLYQGKCYTKCFGKYHAKGI